MKELGKTVDRSMYSASLLEFVEEDSASILGRLVTGSSGTVELTQKNAWIEQISILKAVPFRNELLSKSRVYFEFQIPRLGRRADVVLLIEHVLFVLEFKVGEKDFNRGALDQVWDYALDLRNFHDTSHDICIVPILIATSAECREVNIDVGFGGDNRMSSPMGIAASQIGQAIEAALSFFQGVEIDSALWEAGRYLPTPTIVEAARALYAGHSVEEISRNGAGDENLSITSKSVDEVIRHSRKEMRKAICFVTGVQGAGKTLVGLDVANRNLSPDGASYSVFLSGNGPLVSVLREALVRDRVASAKASGERLKKVEARQGVEAFIQNVHHFRDEYLRNGDAPPEHVVLFDEAQRAWNLEQTQFFMRQKKGYAEFLHSEPEFLISCLERHQDWCVVVCLVGSGQEINTGEGGISEWFEAILKSFPSWDVYLSPNMSGSEYKGGEELTALLGRENTYQDPALHLATSMRSFRAESLSQFVRQVLELEENSAAETLAALSERYPIRLTRDLGKAKEWLRKQARGSERYGIMVSSQAERLKPYAIDVRIKTDPVKWFLDGKDDTRSSYYLEEVATEFQVQGLELDWACVVWDGDLRYRPDGWAHHQFRGTRWNRVNKPERQKYLVNAYRVLLTRARQGMVIVVPEGSAEDLTRASSFYDPTFNYLRSLGVKEL